MQLPVQIAFRNMSPSAAIETKARQRAHKLEEYFDRILSCRVVVEERHRHRHQGNLFHVTVDVKVPGAELVASRDPALELLNVKTELAEEGAQALAHGTAGAPDR